VRVLSSQEFRDFANECLDWAKTAQSDNERDIFLQMAQVWIEATVRSEGTPTKVERARHQVITRLAGNSSGNLAKFAAGRRASSFVSSLADDRRPDSSSK
jgi:hypothetical protein